MACATELVRMAEEALRFRSLRQPADNEPDATGLQPAALRHGSQSRYESQTRKESNGFVTWHLEKVPDEEREL